MGLLDETRDFRPDPEPAAAPSLRPFEPREPEHSSRAGRGDLLEALQELSTALRNERANSKQLHTQLERTRAVHAKELAEREAQTRAIAERERKLLETQPEAQMRERALQNQIATLEQEIQKLHAQLTRAEQDRSEEQRKLNFELELMRAAQQHRTNSDQSLTRMLSEARNQYDRLRNKAQAILQAYRNAEQRRQELQMKLQVAEKLFEPSKRELVQLRTALHHANRTAEKASFERDQLLSNLKSLKNRSLLHAQRSNGEQEKIKDLQSSIESERNEKHMVLSCLRSAEAKLGQKEELISHLTRELEVLRQASETRASAKSHAAPDTISAEEAQNLCDRYFVAYPAES